MSTKKKAQKKAASPSSSKMSYAEKLALSSHKMVNRNKGSDDSPFSALYLVKVFIYIVFFVAAIGFVTMLDNEFQLSYSHLMIKKGLVGILFYLSLLMIFPFPLGNKLILLLSLFSGFVLSYSIPWQLTWVFIAWQRIFIEVICFRGYRRRQGGFLFFLCFVSLAMYFSFNFPFPETTFLMFYVISNVLGVMLLLIWQKKITYLFNTLLKYLNKKREEDNTAALEEKAFQERLMNYQKLIKSLKNKQNKLPKSMVLPLNKVFKQTDLIIKCMQDDPRDRVPAGNFLQHNLPLINRTVDKSLRIMSTKQKSPKMQEILKKNKDFLYQQVTAFSALKKQLLENNKRDLRAHIKVLDKLLIMDGYAASGDGVKNNHSSVGEFSSLKNE